MLCPRIVLILLVIMKIQKGIMNAWVDVTLMTKASVKS